MTTILYGVIYIYTSHYGIVGPETLFYYPMLVFFTRTQTCSSYCALSPGFGAMTKVMDLEYDSIFHYTKSFAVRSPNS